MPPIPSPGSLAIAGSCRPFPPYFEKRKPSGRDRDQTRFQGGCDPETLRCSHMGNGAGLEEQADISKPYMVARKTEVLQIGDQKSAQACDQDAMHPHSALIGEPQKR